MREDEEALKRCFRNYKVQDCENTNKTLNMIIAVWVLRTMLRNWGGIRECCEGKNIAELIIMRSFGYCSFYFILKTDANNMHYD